ncbi:Uncharacterised protein [Mycobacteroides abscessus subsp. abscessus]|nr:Uncharacterised protein [Mycobacteroides abscessus subsp. abscessus]
MGFLLAYRSPQANAGIERAKQSAGMVDMPANASVIAAAPIPGAHIAVSSHIGRSNRIPSRTLMFAA